VTPCSMQQEWACDCPKTLYLSHALSSHKLLLCWQVEFFNTINSIFICGAPMCYDAWQIVCTFSFVTVQVGQWGSHSVELLLVRQLWHPSAAHSVIAFMDIIPDNGLWKDECQLSTASMIHICLPAPFCRCHWYTCLTLMDSHF
jgi:hypothetical protein